MSNPRFKPEYEKWAYQIFDESVECLKDGLNPLSIQDFEGKKLVVNEAKREHAVFCIVRYLELCDKKIHDSRTNVRELFTKFIDHSTLLQSEQEHFLNFLQWLIPLAVDTD